MFCLGISQNDLLIYGIEDKSACAVGGETDGLLVKSKRIAGKSDSLKFKVIHDILSEKNTATCAQTQIAIANLINLLSVKGGYFLDKIIEH